MLPSSISTRLAYQHKSLLDLLTGMTDEQIRIPQVDGKWSVFEHIVHLTTYQHVFIGRVKQILIEANPLLERYVAKSDPLFQENCSRSSSDIIHDLMVTRKELAAEIQTFKTEDFKKTGEHPVFGKMDLVQWLNFFLLHEAHHLFAIFKQVAELRNPGTTH